MSAVLAILVLLGAWLAKQVLGAVLSQQITGSIPEYAARKAMAAARILPAELADVYLEDWLAELEALKNRPLSALRFASGLATAARVIAVMAGRPVRYNRTRIVGYRATDLLGAATALVLLAPTLLMLDILTRAAGPGPILLRLPRRGLSGREFAMLRFAASSRARSGRSIAGVIEATALDELPVFVNVLRGDMSLIGPPPQAHGDSESRRPLEVRPGLFSWERLAQGYTGSLSVDEARSRDQRRRVRDDIALLSRRLFRNDWRNPGGSRSLVVSEDPAKGATARSVRVTPRWTLFPAGGRAIGALAKVSV